MPKSNEFWTAGAVAALLTLSAPVAMAQTQDGTADLTDAVNDAEAPATDGTNTTGPVTDAVNDAEAPATDGINTTGPQMSNGNAGQTIVMDIEGFAQQIYERGFRQGYVSGVSDARAQMMEQVRAMRQAQVQAGQGGQSGSGGEASGQSGGGETAQRQGDGPISDEVAARPGGSIIVLPPGVSPERFIEQLMQQNR